MSLGFIFCFGFRVNTGLKVSLVLGLNQGLVLCLGGAGGLFLGLGLPGLPGLPCEEKAINKVKASCLKETLHIALGNCIHIIYTLLYVVCVKVMFYR